MVITYGVLTQPKERRIHQLLPPTHTTKQLWNSCGKCKAVRTPFLCLSSQLPSAYPYSLLLKRFSRLVAENSCTGSYACAFLEPWITGEKEIHAPPRVSSEQRNEGVARVPRHPNWQTMNHGRPHLGRFLFLVWITQLWGQKPSPEEKTQGHCYRLSRSFP